MKNPSGDNSREPFIKRDWTKGSVTHNLWSLSWPILIGSTLNTIGPTVDMIWVGKLGASSIAGVGVSGLVIMVINSLIMGLFTGTMAMIARFVGAGDEKRANRVAQQAFVVALAFSVLMAVSGVLFSKMIMTMMGLDAEVVTEGAAYLRIQLIGTITMTALQAAQSIMQSSGDAINPLKISIGFRLLQVVLCPALIFGWWIFPQLGVSGASLSNVITQGLGAVMAMIILFTGRSRISVTFRGFKFDRDIIWRTVKIGLPASVSQMARSLSELLLIWFITPFGTMAVAAQSLAQRLDQMVQFFSGGFGNAAGVLAGQNLGAGKADRAEKTTWVAVGFSTLVSIICSVILWFWVVPLLHIFNTQPDLVAMAATFLRIQIVSYMVWGLVIVLSMVLHGVGETVIPLLANVVSVVVIQSGLAYLLPKYTDLGVNGVRWAVVIGIVARAAIYVVYFKSGRWKHKKV